MATSPKNYWIYFSGATNTPTKTFVVNSSEFVGHGANSSEGGLLACQGTLATNSSTTPRTSKMLELRLYGLKATNQSSCSPVNYLVLGWFAPVYISLLTAQSTTGWQFYPAESIAFCGMLGSALTMTIYDLTTSANVDPTVIGPWAFALSVRMGISDLRTLKFGTRPARNYQNYKTVPTS